MVNLKLLSASSEYSGPDGQEVQSCFLPGTNIQFAWDSTSLGYLKTCPRLYQYVMIEGYGEKDESIHLRFGREYHQALEEYDHLRVDGTDHKTALYCVVRDLHARTWDWAVDMTSRAGYYKNKYSLMRSVVWYLEKFKEDPAETYVLANGKPAVELSFRFELDWGPSTHTPFADNYLEIEKAVKRGESVDVTPQPYLLSGHLDRVVDFNGGLFVMDRKTTTSSLGEYYYSQFDMSNQMTLYSLAAQVVIGSPVKGVIIDAAQLLVEATHYGRSITYRNPDFLAEWMEDLNIWLAMAENYAIAGYWPKNDTACDKFGGCRFKAICSKSPTVRDKFLTNFTKLEPADRWNPLKPR